MSGADIAAWQTALGITGGGPYQPLDATLTALAGLVTAADQQAYSIGVDTFAMTALTAAARTLQAQGSQALMRTTGLGFTTVGDALATAASAAAARSTLVLAVDGLNFQIAAPANQDYVLSLKIPFSATFNYIDIKTASGTCSVAVKINATAMTGLGALAVTSVNQRVNATAANVAAIDDTILITVSAGASPLNLQGTLRYTR